MAKNEYGIGLDRNGYAPSIFDIQDGEGNPCCLLCGRTTGRLEWHEIFGGANRGKSKALGLWVTLCPRCHNGSGFGVHQVAKKMLRLHRFGQIEAMRHYGWTEAEFRQRFGKSYLE